MVLTMGKRANKSRDGIEYLPEAQNELLLYILRNGPSPVYGTHRILNRSQSTVQTSMKELEKEGLVHFVRDEPSEKNRTKNIYGLTLGGFCYGFCVIVRSQTTNYPMIKGVIGRWQHLCPEILGNWNNLTKEKQEGCSFPADFEKKSSKIPSFQLPYEVPNTITKYWILFIEGCCREVILSCSWRNNQKYHHISSKRFIEQFGADILEGVLNGSEIWDLNYNMCVARKIPQLWGSIYSDLIDWKKSFEERAMLIGHILDK